MSLIYDWIARLRGKPAPKSRESVLAFDKYADLTATQAIRFQELQAAMLAAGDEVVEEFPEQPWYSLQDASSRLATSQPELLAAAAEGQLNCFVYSRNAQGYWDASQLTPVPGSVPDFLLLPARICREIAANGSATASELEFHHGSNQVLRYRLTEPTWIDADTLYLQHPLPDAQALNG